MKKLFNIITIVVLNALIFTSCQKKSTQKLDNLDNITSNNASRPSVQNTNPLYFSLYDSIGNIHNQDLSFIFSSIGLDLNNISGFNYNNGTDSEITAANINFLHTLYPDLEQSDINHLTIVADSIIQYYYVPDFYNNIPTNLIQKINGMLDIYYGIDDPNQEITAIDNYFANNINQFNDTLQALTFTAFMGTLKHSTIFWSNSLSNNSILNNSLTLQSEIHEDWKTVAVTDGLGAGAGAWDLGSVGALLGPGGAIALGIVGAICGGAEASAGDILVSHVVRHI